MLSIEFDLSKSPDLSEGNPTDGTIVSHQSRPTKLLCLGDDDTLRVDGNPVTLYLHHQQHVGNWRLTLDDVLDEIMLRNVACGGLAVALHRNPGLIPRSWMNDMELLRRASGILFWGTRVRSSTRGRNGRVKLALQDGVPILSIIDEDRLISTAPTVLYI